MVEADHYTGPYKLTSSGEFNSSLTTVCADLEVRFIGSDLDLLQMWMSFFIGEICGSAAKA